MFTTYFICHKLMKLDCCHHAFTLPSFSSKKYPNLICCWKITHCLLLTYSLLSKMSLIEKFSATSVLRVCSKQIGFVVEENNCWCYIFQFQKGNLLQIYMQSSFTPCPVNCQFHIHICNRFFNSYERHLKLHLWNFKSFIKILD